MKATEIKVNPDTMKAEIDVTTVPRVILVSGGKANEMTLPHHGKFVIKIAQGRIQKYEKRRGTVLIFWSSINE